MIEIFSWKHKVRGVAAIGTLIAVLTGAAISILFLKDQLPRKTSRQITVVGEGKTVYRADTANVTLGVQVDKAPDAETAINQLGGRMNNLISAVKAFGIPAGDIQTQFFGLYPQYDYKDNVQILNGYNANQQLLVKVRNLQNESDQIGKLLAAATKAGANQIINTTFEFADLSSIKQQARISAIVDAKSKAAALADALGVRLGDIISLQDAVSNLPPEIYGGYGGEKGGSISTPPQFPNSNQELVVMVNVIYRIR